MRTNIERLIEVKSRVGPKDFSYVPQVDAPLVSSIVEDRNMKRVAVAITSSLAVLSLGASSVVLAQVEGSIPASSAPSEVGSETDLADVEAGPLAPGTYVDDSFGPTVHFAIGEGWRLVEPDAEDVGFTIAFRQIPLADLDVTPFDGRFPPQDCIAVGGAGGAGFVAGDPSVQGLIDRVRKQATLRADAPEPVEIAGHHGMRIDATAEVPESCEPRAMIWVVPPYDVLDYTLGDGQQARLNVLDVAGDIVVVGFAAREADFEAMVEAVQPVLKSMTIVPASE